MDYSSTLEYLYSQLPAFTRVGASAINNTLDNTLALCEVLGNPQHKFKSIHVGGTNGKGSTSHMLAAILQIAGYKIGLYTSPHLKDFRERIRINGKMIAEQTVVEFVEKHQSDFERIKPSFFEMTVGLAFDVFATENVDIAVIEVGLGGRLDSTNVISPLLSIITNIGWDHTNLLGDTLTKIAAEKAGIIKKNTPVIISERQQEVDEVFEAFAIKQNAPITFATDIISIESESDVNNNRKKYNIKADFLPTDYSVTCDLTGTYQRKNLKGVFAAIRQLKRIGFTITDEHIQAALKQVSALTGLHGRWETLGHSPLVICDTGHNPDGMEEVLKNIRSVNYEHLHMVIGMVNDKDISKVMSMLPKSATYYFCRPNIPRGLNETELQQQAASYRLRGNTYPSVSKAILAAKQSAHVNDLIFIGGSTFVVAEIDI